MPSKMKLMAIVPLCAIILSAPASAQAQEWIRFDTVRFHVSGDQPLVSFEQALEDLSMLSRAYEPDGADISDLRVLDQGPRGLPRVIFNATRGVGFVRYTAQVKADIDTRKKARECARVPGSKGYRILVNTTESDNLVSANVSVLVITLCARELEGQHELEVIAHGKMKKGHDYGRFAGPAITRLIEAQTGSLLSALRQVIAFYQRPA